MNQLTVGTWVRPAIRQSEFGSERRRPNKVHLVGELAPGGEWWPMCQLRGRQYTLLPGLEKPASIDRCINCLRSRA